MRSTLLPSNFNPLISYNVTDTARMLGISRGSVYTYMRDGRLDRTIGRKEKAIRVTGKSILRYFNTR